MDDYEEHPFFEKLSNLLVKVGQLTTYVEGMVKNSDRFEDRMDKLEVKIDDRINKVVDLVNENRIAVAKINGRGVVYKAIPAIISIIIALIALIVSIRK